MPKTFLLFIAFAFALVAPSFAASPITPRNVAELRAHPRFAVTVDDSGSMFPMLKCGDKVAVTVTAFDSVAVGDVVVYWPQWGNGPVIHLVISKMRGGFICRGINNRFNDPEVMTAETFVGIAEMTTKTPPTRGKRN